MFMHKIENYFTQIEDPRVVGRCTHLLSDILLIGLCTYLTGGSDYQDMSIFAKERGISLSPLLQLPGGAPSPDTFERVFQRINPEALESCLRLYGLEILETLKEKQIILDGKKLKGASPKSKGNKGAYIMNAWVSENCFCIAQQRIEDKTNEITAIPLLLDSLDISDAVVSIDAIGTQTKIASQIRKQKGHYFLSVKGNQNNLLEDIEFAFRANAGLDCFEELDYGHGRIETRKCSILLAQDYLLDENYRAWKDIHMLIKIESSRDISGERTQETRYYISDETLRNASYYNSLARGHWGIENNLHWHLDVTFSEDQCRARKGHAPENLSTIRKLALQIISNANDKLSLKKRQYKAALDGQYIKKLIGF